MILFIIQTCAMNCSLPFISLKCLKAHRNKTNCRFSNFQSCTFKKRWKTKEKDDIVVERSRRETTAVPSLALLGSENH